MQVECGKQGAKELFE